MDRDCLACSMGGRPCSQCSRAPRRDRLVLVAWIVVTLIALAYVSAATR